ncbi:MAG: PAS domain S-box protein [candidate division KSB1 bacterium]|nr:PAS domain S-box protein [candidate division KSB1 bacterium]
MLNKAKHSRTLFIVKRFFSSRLALVSLVFGVFIWVIDTLLDWLIFYRDSFWNLLIWDVPSHELYVRTLIVAAFLVFGAIIKSVMLLREQTESRLKQSEIIINSVFDYANIGISITYPDMTWMRVNERYCDIVGYSFSELESLTWLDITHPKDRERDVKEFQRIIQGEINSYQMEKRFVSKSGQTVPVFLTVSCVRNDVGELLYSIATIQDITERKQMVESLQTSQQRLMRAEIVSKSGNWEFDLNTRLVRASAGARRIYGIWDEQVTIERVQQIPLKEYRPMLNKALQDLINGEKEYQVDFKLWRLTDGKIIDIHSVAEYDQQQNLVYGIIQDVSAFRQVEQQMRESRNFLQGVFNSIQDGISVVNPDFTIRYTNPVMEKWYASNMPLVGKKCFRCYHNADRVCVPCPTKRALEQGVTQMNIVRGLPDSPVEWIELYSYPLKDVQTGEIFGVIEFVRDITQRVRDENQTAGISRAPRRIGTGTDQGNRKRKQGIGILCLLGFA